MQQRNPDATGHSSDTQTRVVYVSITGLELKGWHCFPRFALHAFRAMVQARRAPGNLSAEAKTINGVQHTLTVWSDRAAMQRFIYSGAHARAIKVFDRIATGKTFGYATDEVPGWDEVHALWHERGRDYSG